MEPSGLTIRAFGIGLERGATMSDHAFGWGQLIYASSGVGRVAADDAQWLLPVARALWVPPRVRHTLHCTTRLELRTLYIPPDLVPIEDRSCVVLGVGDLLRELILRLTTVESSELRSTRVQRLVAVLFDEMSAAPRTALDVPLPRRNPARRLAERLLADPASGQSLDDACGGIGASRRTLERHFLSQTGTSLGAWYRLVRLHHGVAQLGLGKSTTEVAEALGYSSPSAFVVAFKGVFGTTPARYFRP